MTSSMHHVGNQVAQTIANVFNTNSVAVSYPTEAEDVSVDGLMAAQHISDSIVGSVKSGAGRARGKRGSVLCKGACAIVHRYAVHAARAVGGRCG